MIRALIALLPVVVLTTLGPGAARADDPAWQRQLVLPGGNVYAATFASPDVVWAAGDGGIFRSIDAGRSWSLAYNSPQPLNAIAATPDGTHGWAVGLLGSIVSTSDGGQTWQQQTSGTQVNLTTVAALGGEKAIAAGVGSGISDVIMEPQPHVILRTDDGGESWSQVRVGGDYRTSEIDFLPDGRHGWMTAFECVPPAGPGGGMGCDASTGAALLQTDDGGRSWKPVAHSVSLYRMQFVSTSTGWAFGCTTTGCSRELARTTDGGVTWQQTRTAAPFTPSAFYAFDAQRAIIAEQRCADTCITQLVETLDGGATWHDVGASTQRFTAVLRFSGDRTGVSFGMGNPALWTADAGATWHDARLPVVVGSGAVDFVDADRGWLAGSELLRTDNDGATWSSVSSEAFSDLAFVSPTEGWATRSDCSGVCATALFHTTDGGATWTQQFVTSDPNIPRLIFTTPADGWLLFESDGRALHTRDGGATWYEQRIPNPGRAVFVDGSVGWSAAAECGPGWSNCRGRAYRTVDGGDTWAPVTDFADGDCYVQSVSATDARRAWVESGSCLDNDWKMHRSEDAGASWSAAPVPSEMSAVTFFDAKTGRAIAPACDQRGCASRLARTSDGGATWVLDATIADANPFGSHVKFASPERAWLVSSRGGGITSVFSQAIWAYAGTESVHPVIAPNAGTGPQLPDDGHWPYAALLAAMGATLIALGGWIRRVIRGSRMHVSEQAPPPGASNLEHPTSSF